MISTSTELKSPSRWNIFGLDTHLDVYEVSNGRSRTQAKKERNSLRQFMNLLVSLVVERESERGARLGKA
ncbi:unnamed protein product, partial [Ceratitis capitata]